jgi:hypothetical protein
MPPNKVRPPAGNRRAQDEAPDDGFSVATLPPTTKTAQARLLTSIEKQLGGRPRCLDCHRPLHVFRSVLIGRGPTCLRRYAQKRSGVVA